MFEVHKRHTPMFVTSEVKRIAEVLTRTLEFDELNLKTSGIELVPLFHSVRINESNPFIGKGRRDLADVRKLLKSDPRCIQLREIGPSVLLEKLVKNLKRDLQLDSYLCLGEQTTCREVEAVLPRATPDSQRPLIVLTKGTIAHVSFENPTWLDLDHPAIWLDWEKTVLSETEAFFSVRPAIKLEVSLNRFEPLESFGNFALGLVRF